MRSILTFAVFSACLALSSSDVLADCQQQHAFVQSEGKDVDNWVVKPGEVHKITLLKGTQLGLQISPATAEKYRELLKKTGQKEFPELVEISIFDLSPSTPTLLSHTWGGANSRQGYGSLSGAAIEIMFIKPQCVKLEELK
ncbi:hypothetical protein [Undibacterium rugosum]|uniref:Uncharacterized protein n=1 Tax=Undibacterium rugosum TaxID=2762291 RepID=A0A923HYJ3_9BURK|nr:hypothetical protein [Undibacterium rugosum]MBC3934538.1 hypothetical protein [Undibacterium rugosum]MBR7777153.1 hypothetical protein [Undibacterium rugosum]